MGLKAKQKPEGGNMNEVNVAAVTEAAERYKGGDLECGEALFAMCEAMGFNAQTICVLGETLNKMARIKRLQER